jgi:hypothetical protein
MGLITFGGVKVTRAKPTISVRIVNNEDSLVTAELLLKRVGTDIDSLAYTPSKVSSDYVEFTFDELLFTENTGRYLASFYVNDVLRSTFNIQYTNDTSIQVANA